jgi:hypothetical protein
MFTASDWEHCLPPDARSRCRVPHSTPDIGSRCPWTPKHLSNPSVLTNLYTMPDLLHGLPSDIASMRSSQTKYLDNVVVSGRLKAVRWLSWLIGQTRLAFDH